MFVVGDPHGNWKGIIAWMRRYNIRNANLIVPGDMLLGYHPIDDMVELRELNEEAENRNIHIHICRGNHDNPKYFDGTVTQFSHIHFHPDYSVVEIEGQQVLFVGGALSPDISVRTVDVDYWVDEGFVLKETDAEPDIVVTHTAPTFVDPHVIGGWGERLIVERHQVSQLYHQLKKKPKLWIYGHFHDHYVQIHEQTKFLCLGIMEFWEYTV